MEGCVSIDFFRHSEDDSQTFGIGAWPPNHLVSCGPLTNFFIYLRPKKKNPMFTVTRPTLIFGPDPKVFINIFLFLIQSCIML